MINRPLRYDIALTLIMLVLASIAFAGNIKWMTFLENPTDATYTTLVQSLKACNKSAKCIEAELDADGISKLLKLIKSGNSMAVDVTFLSRELGIFDGADLEDVIRALGRLAETHPKLLLGYLHKYKMTGYSFEDTLIMLPLETVDDLNAKIRTVQKRIDSISTVNDPSLINERDQAVQVLKRRLAQLQERKEP
jgi:hypothetical protein